MPRKSFLLDAIQKSGLGSGDFTDADIIPK
jgi:hypothetical protein